MRFNASQVGNMLCEMWSGGGKMRLDNLEQCFSTDVRVSSLASGAVLQKGFAKLREVWERSAGAVTAEAKQSVLVESNARAQPSLVLHLYAPSKSPGLTPKGAAEAASTEPLAALYRVHDNKVDHIWVSSEVPATVESRLQLTASPFWAQVMEVVSASITPDAPPTFYWNDYSKAEDALGMGLGSTSIAETWT